MACLDDQVNQLEKMGYLSDLRYAQKLVLGATVATTAWTFYKQSGDVVNMFYGAFAGIGMVIVSEEIQEYLQRVDLEERYEIDAKRRRKEREALERRRRNNHVFNPSTQEYTRVNPNVSQQGNTPVDPIVIPGVEPESTE